MLQQTRVAAVLGPLPEFPGAFSGCSRARCGFGKCGAGGLERAGLLPAGAQLAPVRAADCGTTRWAVSAKMRRLARFARHRAIHGCRHCQHCVWRGRGRGGWQCRACAGKIDGHRSYYAANVAARASTAGELTARRLQSGDDGTGRNGVRAARTTCPECPVRKWCVDAGRRFHEPSPRRARKRIKSGAF